MRHYVTYDNDILQHLLLHKEFFGKFYMWLQFTA